MPHQCTGCGHTFADGSKEMLGGCPDCGGNKFQFHPEGSEVPDQPADATPPDPDTGPGDTASAVGRAATRVRDFVSGDDGRSAPETDAYAAESNASAPMDGTAPDGDASWPSADGSDADEFPTDDGIIDADAHATETAVEDAEDSAQASARREMASDDETPAADAVDPEPRGDEPAEQSSAPADDDARTVPAPGTDDPEPVPDTTSDTDTPPAGEGRVVSEPSGEEAGIDELREQLNDQFESIKIVEPGQYELNLMELYDRDEYIIALQENGRYVIQVPEQWLGDEER